MNFELTQLLEAAGWPQGGRGKWIVDPDSIIGRRRLYEPTLEELVEACGRLFTALCQDADGGWIARGVHEEAHGATAAEAVARLWLLCCA